MWTLCWVCVWTVAYWGASVARTQRLNYRDVTEVSPSVYGTVSRAPNGLPWSRLSHLTRPLLSNPFPRNLPYRRPDVLPTCVKKFEKRCRHIQTFNSCWVPLPPHGPVPTDLGKTPPGRVGSCGRGDASSVTPSSAVGVGFLQVLSVVLLGLRLSQPQ